MTDRRSAPEHAAPSLDELVKRSASLIRLPQVYSRVRDAMNNPSSSVFELASVMEHDPGLAARLLRTANSPYWGTGTRVESMDRAVTALGIARIESLILACCVIDSLTALSRDRAMQEFITPFWRESVYRGACARMLARPAEVAWGERLFVSGLLARIGHLVMMQCVPGLSLRLFERAAAEMRPVYLIEREELGYDHGELGAAVLCRWGFPLWAEAAVRDHISDERGDAFRTDAIVVRLACAVTAAERKRPCCCQLAGEEALHGVGLSARDINDALPAIARSYELAVAHLLGAAAV